VSWNWNFGDGGTSMLQNPTHIYATPGTFTVTLTVTDAIGCKATVSKLITVALATADFTFTPVKPCVGDTVQFTDTSTSTDGPIVSWVWNFGDGGTSIGQNPTHTYTATGTYIITLQVTDANGCTASISRTITVSPLPTANFTFTRTLPCVGELVRFTDASTSLNGAIVNWSWDFGDGGTSTGQNPTHTYTSGGNFIVTLQVTDVLGCKASVSKTITIAVATADFSFTPGRPCVGDAIQFTDASSSTGGPIVSWSWSFGDASSGDIHGGSSTLKNPTYTYSATGTFAVTLTVTDANGCMATKVKNVTVIQADHVPPFCGFTIDANNNIVVTIGDLGDNGVEDASGIAEINVLSNVNGMPPVFDRPFTPCETKYIRLTIQPIDPAFPAIFNMEVKDCCGNRIECDPAFLRAAVGGPAQYEFKLSSMDKYLYVDNDGLAKIDLRINNRPLELVADPIRRYQSGHRQYMPVRGDICVDVSSYMTEAENDVVLRVTGPSAASAKIIFADAKLPTSSPVVLPQDFTLYQNYPNPFNPSTTIEYTVPATFQDGAKVELVIFNALGQRVKILENGVKAPNLYSVQWNGTDEFGRVVPTGIYIYRIKVGDFTAVKRMSLMK
jgi:PKD repeat protein